MDNPINPSWQQFANTAYQNLAPAGSLDQNRAPSVPAWLQPNMSELQGMFSKVPQEYQDVISPLRSAYQNTINFNTGLGTQAANNAASEYATRAQQAGSSGQAAGVVRAQSLLPVLQENAQARTQEAGTEAGFKSQAISLQSQIAQQLASLRTNYASTLANYITAQRGQNLTANADLLSAGVALSTNKNAQGTQPSSYGAFNNAGVYYPGGSGGYESLTNGIL